MATATIKAVVFDFFGTLTLPVSRGSQKRAVIPVAQALGVPTDRLMQVTRESFADRTLGRWGSFSQTVERAAREAGAAPSEEALEVACQLRLDGQRRHPMRLRPEAEPTLAALRAMGIAIGVLSDCSHELPMSWSELAIAPFVDAVVFSVEVGIRKPDPRVYEMIVERLAVTAGSCLYVGDGGSHELTGAANAEMTAVLLDDPEGRSAVVYDRRPMGRPVDRLAGLGAWPRQPACGPRPKLTGCSNGGCCAPRHPPFGAWRTLPAPSVHIPRGQRAYGRGRVAAYRY